MNPQAPRRPNRSPASDESPEGRRQRETPTPSRSQTPEMETAAGSSPVSSGSEFLADPGHEFLADPGPEFDPKRAPAAPEVEPELVAVEEWEEKQVRELLTLQGEIAHAFLSAGEDDKDTWIHTERDLNAIAPPLTRIMNRYDAMRAAAAAGDEILLASAVSRYGARNYIKRRRYIAAIRAAEPQPITGVDAPPESGPESDEDWQRTHDPMFDAPPAIVPKGGRR